MCAQRCRRRVRKTIRRCSRRTRRVLPVPVVVAATTTASPVTAAPAVTTRRPRRGRRVARRLRRERRKLRRIRKRVARVARRARKHPNNPRLRRAVRRARKALRRERKIVRRLRAAVVTPSIPSNLPARLRRHPSRISRACRGSIRRLRHAVRRGLRRAAACNDNGACSKKAYRRVARLRRRLAAARRNCLRSGLPIRAPRKVRPVPFCKHAKRQIARLESRRSEVMRRIRRCSDEDTKCSQRGFRKILRLNRYIAQRAKRCNVKLPRRVRRSVAHIQIRRVSSNGWRHALTCDGIRMRFKRWIHYQNLRRIALHLESSQCSPLDVSCLKFAFTQIVHIQRRIAQARNRMSERLRVCDDCAPLKLRFRRWLRRQRARRARIHRSILRCGSHNVDCLNRKVARIARIQERIRARRAAVRAAQNVCSGRNEVQFTTTASTTNPSPFAPVILPGSRLPSPPVVARS